jgi:hypothetical protein
VDLAGFEGVAAVSDVLWFGVVFAAVCIVGYVGFLAGRDAAAREADSTIANLRRSNRVLRSEIEQQRFNTGRGKAL